MGELKNRYDFVLFFDVTDGNPNGDPDAGNHPRVDDETGQGLVSDVCLKRKVRNYVDAKMGNAPGYKIFIQDKAVLNERQELAYKDLGLKPASRKLPKDKEDAKKLTEWMCANYYDIRAFGAVMTTEVNCGQVQGPLQLTISRSVDPIAAQEISVTRMAVTKEADREKERTFGKKYVVPYGLYRLEGFVSASLAAKTHFSQEDLNIFWEALGGMFENDRSAARGKMTARRLITFKHDGIWGKSPAQSLFDLVTVRRVKDDGSPPRRFEDYEILVNASKKPAGVEIEERI